MNKQKALLFVGAHPDDETFGLGGTLVHYASQGVKVYYACATRGEAGVTADPDCMRGYAEFGDMRWAELQCAARALHLTDVIYLGYRDSGMPGSNDNKDLRALINAPFSEVVDRIVKVIREIRPEVIITFDPQGGYGHPDHVTIHKAAVAAFSASGKSEEYLDAGPVYQPQKLYFSVFPHTLLKIAVKIMPLVGKDPTKFGRNKDINIASVAQANFPIHASIHLNMEDIVARKKAYACHRSQLSGGPPGGRLSGLINKIIGQHDNYSRIYPQFQGTKKETGLFMGI